MKISAFSNNTIEYGLALALLSACEPGGGGKYLPLTVERHHEKMEHLFEEEPTALILGEGFEWTEGPLWVDPEQMLLFSDIPNNKVYKWTEEEGVTEYLEPAGYTGETPRGGESGSNGLLLNPNGELVLCQHGDRRMAVMDAPLGNPQPSFRSIVDNYEGSKFNSPNDAVYDRQGNLYFTDPPYGLEKNMEDPGKELPFQGVYTYSKEGNLTLLLDSISRPNGLAFLPDEKTLIIANSDPEKPYWYAYDVGGQGELYNGRIFYDASEAFRKDAGLPDGLKVNKEGILFATGPGGLWVFDSSGNLWGRLKVGELTSNVALDGEEKNLYITADSFVIKIAMKE